MRPPGRGAAAGPWRGHPAVHAVRDLPSATAGHPADAPALPDGDDRTGAREPTVHIGRYVGGRERTMRIPDFAVLLLVIGALYGAGCAILCNVLADGTRPHGAAWTVAGFVLPVVVFGARGLAGTLTGDRSLSHEEVILVLMALSLAVPAGTLGVLRIGEMLRRPGDRPRTAG